MCGVAEYPVTTASHAGGPGVLLLTWSIKARQQDGIPQLATPAYLRQFLHLLRNVHLARCFSRCVCFMLNLVTFATLDGNQVAASRNLLYSRLISCTRDSSVVLETHQLYPKD